MSEHDDSSRRDGQDQSFWKSTAGLVFLGFLGVIGLLLVYEHRMHIFTGDYLIVGLLFACILMHLFMHGGHGGHGGGHGKGDGS